MRFPYPIIVAIVALFICYMNDFPGGPTGFAIATKEWLKRKSLALMSKTPCQQVFCKQPSWKFSYPHLG